MARCILLMLAIGCGILLAALGVACDEEPAAGQKTSPGAVAQAVVAQDSTVQHGAAPTRSMATPALITEPAPERVRLPSGEPFQAGRGVYYVDPATGEIEGWQLPERPAGDWLPAPYPTSSTGRYLTYRAHPAGQGPLTDDRFFDTHTGAVRALPDLLRHAFAPDDSRYLAAEADGIAIHHAETGAVERTVPLAGLGYKADLLRGVAWSPVADAALIWIGPLTGAAPVNTVIHIDVTTGAATAVDEGVFAHGAWSADGRRYFIARQDAVEARDAADGRAEWRLTAADLGLSVTLRGGVEPLGGVSPPFEAPDGRSAVVLATSAAEPGENSSYRAYVIDPDTGVVRFAVENVLACGRRWTADSRWLHVVGERGGEAGSFLVAADGTRVRALGRFVMDLSPVDPRLAGYRPFEDGGPSLAVLDLETSATRPLARIAGEWGWDTLHHPLWLDDGRLVVHAPHFGHGGCGFYESPGELTIRRPG